MSYASKTKTKLAKITLNDVHLKRAELSALVRCIGELKLGTKGKINLSITTENSASARRIIQHIKEIYKQQSDVIVKKNRSLKRHNIYEVITDDAKHILIDLGILSEQNGLSIMDEIPPFIIKSDSRQRAYIRGAFLAVGSMNAPDKGYHFELALHEKNYAKRILELLNGYDLNAKNIERKKKYVIYLKDADKIVDVLNIIGAHDALLALENIRIVKSIRNKANRATNCDTANVNKMMAASDRQIRAIKAIEVNNGIDSLPRHLAEIAMLRLENPELTLAELGQSLEPPIGKSGINHRMKKIEAIADQYLKR